MRDLSRLLRPKSIALFGGGWAANVISQLRKSGFAGDILPVHPKRGEIEGITCFRSIGDLPTPPDASFIGVNREATIDVVRSLRDVGAGGATCFASGFSESEGTGGTDLQARLVDAAGAMPILGPNCYGFLNYLDNVTLWPDQHGGSPCDRGVAIIAQSSNIAINMTMQKRALPIAYVVAAGNQAQTDTSDIASALLDDERVSAIGLYLEGFGDIRALEVFAARARAKNKPIVALKIGRSEKAQIATITHTASLAGSAAVSSALLKRLGIIEVNSIAEFLETLKLLHMIGPLMSNAICSISCSGGEASLISDMAVISALHFRDFSAKQSKALKDELGPIVTVSNPLDYHTFIWGDTQRMTKVFADVMRDKFDLCVFVLDIPRNDKCDPSSYDCAIEAIIAAKQETGANVAILSSLSENLSEEVSARFVDAGIVPLHGMTEGLKAIEAVIAPPVKTDPVPLILNDKMADEVTVLSEAEAKKVLKEFGLSVPQSVAAPNSVALVKASVNLLFPVALKGMDVVHKTESNAVVLDIADASELDLAATGMKGVSGFLLEEMVTGGVAEILIGVTRDATGIFMLTIGAGGVLTELLDDNASVLLPTNKQEILDAIASLRLAKILDGYRGKSAADLDSIVDAVLAIAAYAEAKAVNLLELDVNPLIARKRDAIAVDALIRLQG